MATRPGARAAVVAAVAAAIVVCGFTTAPSAGLSRESARHPEDRGPSAPQQPAAGPAVVGALFTGSLSGGHFCTASVVASPGQNLLMTAAHCIYDGSKGGYAQDVAFVPGYHDGQAPYGIWTAERMLVSPQWVHGADPDYDVGFIVLRPLHGRNIQQVLGANEPGWSPGYTSLVRVSAYPSSSGSPVTCVNRTSQESVTQLEFDCGGFAGGTSGGPWVLQPASPSRVATVIGVIGGYQEGGDSPSVSFSPYFGSGIRQLYEQAGALSRTVPGHG